MSNRSLPFPTPSLLLRAYALGIFPMADSATAKGLRWFDPPIRALIPLDERFHVPRRLARTLKKTPYRVTLNRAFTDVMKGCADPCEGRENTWINAEIMRLYASLFFQGHAHSIEVWDGRTLVGGLYGVSMGAAFFGESMFCRSRDASKIALVHLVGLLRQHNFMLLDTQFQTPHLEHFGTFEVVRSVYHSMLHAAIGKRVKLFSSYPDWSAALDGVLSLHPVTHIS